MFKNFDSNTVFGIFGNANYYYVNVKFQTNKRF